MAQYRETPFETEAMPPGVPYIVSNEAAERFSFYGMKTILVVFMTKHLLGADGQAAPMTDEEAKYWYHMFTSAVYFLPFFGAIIADAFFGKYVVIIALSLVYCLGHFALALDETRLGLAIGLSLIAIGGGGIKPCVSAHVGDQFGERNQGLLERVYGWFYLSINIGSLISTLLTPILLQHVGPSLAFGVPGILMVLATLAFWMGRHRFAHIPAAGSSFVREAFSREGLGAMGRLFVIYLFVAMFWSLFDQTGSAWVLQADHMDRRLLGVELLPAQIQAANPLLVVLFIPLFSYVIYPAINRFFPLTPLRKIGIGFFVAAVAFVIPAAVEARISAGDAPSIGYQLLAYVVLTAAEILISITCLEFSYTQAPNRMKSLVMATFLMSVSVGNLFTAAVNKVIQNADGTSKLAGADYYLFFAGAMFATAVLFIFVAMRYRERRYIQGARTPAVELP
ncbi:MAG: POT family MFS transporter [Myxococcales bacterium]|nr:POT family MFS transporter [Myxococcales bacterium]